MPRKEQGWITFQSSSEERQILEHYCQQTQRSKTEVLRALVRSLEPVTDTSPLPSDVPETSPTSAAASYGTMTNLGGIRVSARNLIQGTVKQMHNDGVNTEIVLEIAPQVELTAVITSASVQRLGLHVGKSAYAMIKSSNIMVAVEEGFGVISESCPT